MPCFLCISVHRLRRYEKTAFQCEVQRGFDACQDSSWLVLDASKTIEDLQLEVKPQTFPSYACGACKPHMLALQLNASDIVGALANTCIYSLMPSGLSLDS